jgi:hypothetical protein
VLELQQKEIKTQHHKKDHIQKKARNRIRKRAAKAAGHRKDRQCPAQEGRAIGRRSIKTNHKSMNPELQFKVSAETEGILWIRVGDKNCLLN